MFQEYQSSAYISNDGLYRYSLFRSWGSDGKHCAFIMLNPSTADAAIDDPTIRRCLGFAKSWSCTSLTVLNLFSYRSTNPFALRGVADPVGPLGNKVFQDTHKYDVTDYCDEMEERFCALLDHCTGGMMSKSNHTLIAMTSAVDEHYEKAINGKIKDEIGAILELESDSHTTGQIGNLVGYLRRLPT